MGGAIGNTGVGYLVKKYKKTWFIVALLSAVLALSTFLMGYAGYERGMVGLAHGKNQVLMYMYMNMYIYIYIYIYVYTYKCCNINGFLKVRFLFFCFRMLAMSAAGCGRCTAMQ
jgi:hypothetical protein